MSKALEIVKELVKYDELSKKYDELAKENASLAREIKELKDQKTYKYVPYVEPYVYPMYTDYNYPIWVDTW